MSTQRYLTVFSILVMAKQDLDRSKIAGGLVDHGSLRSPQGMRPVILPTKPDRRHPLINQSGVLPSAEMISVVDATGKGIVIDCSSTSLKPGKQTGSDLGRNFELHGSSSLLLDDHRSSSNVVAGDECPIFSFTRSQPRSLRSMARSKSARSRILPSRSKPAPTAVRSARPSRRNRSPIAADRANCGYAVTNISSALDTLARRLNGLAVYGLCPILVRESHGGASAQAPGATRAS